MKDLILNLMQLNLKVVEHISKSSRGKLVSEDSLTVFDLDFVFFSSRAIIV